MKDKIFRSYFTLYFEDQLLNSKYEEIKYQKILKLLKYISTFLLFCYSLYLILLVVYYYSIPSTGLFKRICLMSCTFTITVILTVLLYCSKLKESKISVKLLTLMIFYFFSLAFANFRFLIVTTLKLPDSYFYYHIIGELILRIIWVNLGLLDYIEYFYITFLYSCTHCIFLFIDKALFNFVERALGYYLFLFVSYPIVYFITLEYKKAMYYNNKVISKCAYYESIIQNMNSGFLHIKNNNIHYINLNLINRLKNKIFSEEDNNQNIKNCFNLEYIDFLQQNKKIAADIISYLIININECDSSKIKKNSDNDDAEKSENLEYQLEKLKNIYLNSEYSLSNNFIYLGCKNYTELDVIYEISFRFYRFSDNNNQELNFELIFNDVTNIKQKEERNAEFKFKSLYLSKIAHEFKNPLICIIELIELICENVTKFKNNSISNTSLIDLNKHLSTAKSFSLYLLILIKDLDHFSKRQLDQPLNIEVSNVKVSEIFNFCSGISDCLISRYNKGDKVKFEYKIDDKVTTVNTDEYKLKQILINLISNSIKFTYKGYIIIEARFITENNLIRFSVKDTGIGMTDELQMNLFKPFVKGYAELNKIGAGLGLNIVNELCSEIGSKVNFKSNVNKGTEFWFDIYSDLCDNISVDNTKEINLTTIEKLNASYHTTNLQNETKLNQSLNKTIKIESFNNIESFNKFLINTSKENICLKEENPYICCHKQYIFNAYINTESNKLPYISENTKTILLVDDETLARGSCIRTLKSISKEYNISLNIEQAADGIEALFIIYKYLNDGLTIDTIITDETMTYLNGTILSEIYIKFIKSKTQSNIPIYLLTAYEDSNTILNIKNEMIFESIFTKPLSKSAAANIFAKLKLL